MSCEHEFDSRQKVVLVRRFLGFVVGRSIYSFCSKCSAVRHDDDGHIFSYKVKDGVLVYE